MKALVTGPPPGKSWMRRPLKRTYGMYDITSKEEMGWIRWVEEKEVVKGEMRRRVELIRKMKEDEERRGVKRVLTKRRVWTGKVIYSDDGATTATTTSSMGKENEGHNKKEKGKQVETGAKTNEDEDDTNEVYPPNQTSLAG
ncbi:hypothetical protein BDN72DRAFT_847826 [Pluteus cervinus]|uniref:Uncharacterized protein n=1 Tax=Pluteus cervinus TaxID=181527 RepID=A0ACD3ABF0_9AGAR|nr:hypothetical protein BDN72DRAFT_847826 [Pluteus cervinus]